MRLTFLATALATALMGFRPSLDLTKPGIESPFTYSFNRASAAGQRSDGTTSPPTARKAT